MCASSTPPHRPVDAGWLNVSLVGPHVINRVCPHRAITLFTFPVLLTPAAGTQIGDVLTSHAAQLISATPTFPIRLLPGSLTDQ